MAAANGSSSSWRGREGEGVRRWRSGCFWILGIQHPLWKWSRKHQQSKPKARVRITPCVCVCVCVCVLVDQSCLILCDPMDCSPPGSSVHGILQARILEWVAIPFSRGSFQPRDWTCVFCIGRRILCCLSHHGSPELFLSIPKLWVWGALCMHKNTYRSALTWWLCFTICWIRHYIATES